MLNPFAKKTKKEEPKAAKPRPSETKHAVKKTAKPVEAKKTKSVATDAQLIRASEVVFRPVVSEKGTMLSEMGKYLFEVNPSANRIEIKKGVERMYNVHVEGINIIPVRSRFVRYGKSSGWTKRRKKAIVQLRKGEKIEISKGV